MEIILHIKALHPPGRFLKRDGKGQVSRGLSGPWKLLSENEAAKKTCQALRDCNRNDRSGYAEGVKMPVDVKDIKKKVSSEGLSMKERAKAAAIKVAKEAANNAQKAASENIKRRRQETLSLSHTTSATRAETQVQLPAQSALMTTHHLPFPHRHSVPPVNSPIIMSAVTGIPTFSHTVMHQNQHNHHQFPTPYIPQIAQHQHHQQSYLPYATTAAAVPQPLSPQIPPAQDLSSNHIFTSSNHTSRSAHVGNHTPSSSNVLLCTASHVNSNCPPIKKQRSIDDAEPSVVSNSPSASTSLDACSFIGSTPGSHSTFPTSYVENGGRNVVTNVGTTLFPIKEDGVNANFNGSKNVWDVGGVSNESSAGPGVESDQDQFGDSLHSF